METRITVNGVDYKSVDEMPPGVREAYERAMSMLADRNNDGVPDIVDGAQVQVDGDGKNISVSSVTTTNIDVRNWKDLPPHVKTTLQNAAKADRVSFGLNVGFHDRVPRSAEKSRRRGIQTLIVVAIVLTIWGIMWTLRRS